MSRPTNAQNHRQHERIDNGLKSLRTPAEGGPSYVEYDGMTDADFQAQHPRYPDYHYPDDRDIDTLWAAKDELAAGLGAKWNLSLGNEDARYLIQKKEAQEMVRFKQFVEDSIPRGTPWAKDFFEKIYPGWYQSKVDIINDKLGILQRFVDITIRGPQNMEDMYLLYQAYTGRITLPQSFQDVIRPQGQGKGRTEFASGLFCPKRFSKDQILISKRNQDFMANFAIPGIDLKGMAANDNAADAARRNNTILPWAMNDQHHYNVGDGAPNLAARPHRWATQGLTPELNAAGAYTTPGYFGNKLFSQSTAGAQANPEYNRAGMNYRQAAREAWDNRQEAYGIQRNVNYDRWNAVNRDAAVQATFSNQALGQNVNTPMPIRNIYNASKATGVEGNRKATRFD